jgi:dimethylaniline monooxygenase (N-oxide forming)
VCLPSRSRSSLTFLLNLEINPEIQLTILESESKLGGVWNEDRCFPGFLADSPTGLFDFSDLPMRDVIELKDWADLPGYK